MSIKWEKYWWWLELLLLAVIIVLGGWWRWQNLTKPTEYMFDEVYHVPTIRMMARGDPRAYEWWHGELEDERQSGTYVDWLHPPLAKLMAAASVRILGDNSFAWRAPSALMGTLLIWLVYCLARAIFPELKGAGLLAAFLVAVDGLSIAQSRIAMNDIFVTVFTSAGLLCYWHYEQKNSDHWLLLTAIMSGLAVASKWSGAVLGLFLLVFEVMKVANKKSTWQKSLRFLVIAGLTTGLIYLLSFWQLFQTHNWGHFLELENQVLRYQTELNATHPYSSPAWQWPLALKPVFIYYNAASGYEFWNRPNYVFWYIALVSGFIAVYWLWRRETPAKMKQKLLFLLTAYICFWLPWCFSPRIMFFHHYLPASIIVWVVAGAVWAKLWNKSKKSHGERKG